MRDAQGARLLSAGGGPIPGGGIANGRWRRQATVSPGIPGLTARFPERCCGVVNSSTAQGAAPATRWIHLGEETRENDSRRRERGRDRRGGRGRRAVDGFR